MSLSVHIDNKITDILILGEGPTQGLDDTTLTAEGKHPINSTQSICIKFTLQWKQQYLIYQCNKKLSI